MSETAEYKLLTYSEDGDVTKPDAERTWQDYPGNRRDDFVVEGKPPQGSVLIKTGGNALQAIDSDVLDKQHFISVVVPEAKQPGDTILVNCPYFEGRLISTSIPSGVPPGQTFLVQTPPMIPHVVTGVPVDRDDEEARVHNEHGLIAAAAEHELALREERNKTNRQSGGDGVEMVATNQKAPKGPDGKGWISTAVLTKLMLT